MYYSVIILHAGRKKLEILAVHAPAVKIYIFSQTIGICSDTAAMIAKSAPAVHNTVLFCKYIAFTTPCWFNHCNVSKVLIDSFSVTSVSCVTNYLI